MNMIVSNAQRELNSSIEEFAYFSEVLCDYAKELDNNSKNKFSANVCLGKIAAALSELEVRYSILLDNFVDNANGVTEECYSLGNENFAEPTE